MGTRTDILVWLSLVLFVGCTRVSDTGAPAVSDPTFLDVQNSLLMPKCMSCHAGADSPKGADLSSYSAIMNAKLVVAGKPEQSALYLSVTEGNMPKGSVRLRAAEINLLYRWIKNGALEFQATPEAPPPPPPQPNYAWIQQYVFNSRCITCHNGTHPKSKLDLRNYESFIHYEGEFLFAVEPGDPDLSLLYRVLNEGTMPPPPGDKVSREVVTAIQQWIAAGAKKN